MTLSTISVDSKSFSLKDGRALIFAEYGDSTGFPIFGFHGMPGSRLMMKAIDRAAFACGARIIAPERPGYGISHPQPHGTLAAYPDDILELADALKIDHFAVMGASGGGPYALACAYWLPDRLTVAANVSGIGSLSLRNSTRHMLPPNRIMFTIGRFSPALTGFLLPRLIKSSLPSMEKHIQSGTSPTADISPEIFAILAADQKEAIRTGGQGITFDMKILWRPWGFRFEDIRSKVYLWHGEADNLAPAMLAHYITERIPNCEATFYPGEGHTDPLTKHIDEIMARVVGACKPIGSRQ
jgi:pimeloyl-ACP methyl ester carboxylesterase